MTEWEYSEGGESECGDREKNNEEIDERDDNAESAREGESVVGIAVSCLTSVRVSVFKRCVECVVGSQVTRGMCGVVRRGCPLCLSHDVGMSHTKREVRVFVMCGRYRVFAFAAL